MTSSHRLFFEKIYILSVMDLKLKYQNSFMGFLWSFMKPLLQFLVYYSIFGLLLKISSEENYALALFFGVIIWSWFSEATSLGMNSFIGKKNIITKVKLNKLIPPCAAFLTPTMNYVLNFTVFLCAYLIFGKHLSLWYVLTAGHILLFLFSFFCIMLTIISLNLILANLNVLFRDVQQIWELVLTYGVFLTPIIYHLPIPKRFEKLYYSVNLLAYPLQNMKSIFFKTQPAVFLNLPITASYLLSLSGLIILALIVHTKLSHRMVDYL